jgi:hypothetical protein
MSESCHVNYSFSGIVVLKKKILRNIFHIETHMKTVSPIVASYDPGGHDLNKLESSLYQEAVL